MITFKAFLREKLMNAKTFNDTARRLGSTAKIGFEFELVVPKEASLHGGGGGDDASSLDIDDLITLGDFEEYFEPRGKFAKIRDDYIKWVDNPDDDISSFREFIGDRFDSPAAFLSRYKLFPTFGWDEKGVSIFTAPEQDRANTTVTSHNLKQSLATLVGAPVKVNNSYHGSKKTPDAWYIEPDTSIEAEDGGHGLEIISPPLSLNDAITALTAVSAWMKESGLKTNGTTGFHINVSIPDIKEKLDPVKLILFMGEEYVASAFGRLENSFSPSHISAILAGVRESGRIPATAPDMISTAKKYLRSAKYSSVNIGQLEHGYLEFRIAGGHDYHVDVSKLKKTIYRFVTAVELACNPAAERQDYLKKLSNVFNRAKDDLQSRGDAMALPSAFQRLYKYNADIADEWKEFGASKNEAARQYAAIAFAYTALETASSFRTSLDIKERLALKQIFKSCALQPGEVDKYYGSDHIGRLSFKKEFAL